MPKRHTLPRLWLMTDERMGDRLLPSIAALPKRSGIIFRHYSLPNQERRALFAIVKKLARRRCHCLIVAGSMKLRGDGVHGRNAKRTHAIKTVPVHSVRDIVAAQQSGADLLFISPLFATMSHQGEMTLGRIRFGMMSRSAKTPVIALGGMTKLRAKSLKTMGLYGWAAIDSLTV